MLMAWVVWLGVWPESTVLGASLAVESDTRSNEGFTPRRRYYGCGQALQGLSAGWGDTYKSFLDGQSIHLAVVEDGIYALKSTANPEAILLEADYQNNAALLYLEIRGERIELIAPEELAERRCQEIGWC